LVKYISSNIKDYELCRIQTSSTDDTAEYCEDESAVAPGPYGVFTALCVDGYAYIRVFEDDINFSNEDGVENYPTMCKASTGFTTEYKYKVQCHYDCVDEETTCDEANNPLYAITFDETEDSFSGSGSLENNKFKICEIEDESFAYKNFEIPTGTKQVVLEFDLFEVDESLDVDIRLGDTWYDLAGAFGDGVFYRSQTDFPDHATVGYFNEAEGWIVSSSDTDNHVTITIPETVYNTTGFLLFGLQVTGGCMEIDDLMLSMNCEVPCPAPVLDTLSGEEFDRPTIEILEGNTETVTFAAIQGMSDLTLCTVAVSFKQPSDGSLYCPFQNSVAPGEIDQYEALCESDGYARVSMFVWDSCYSVDKSTAVTVPGECSFSPPSGYDDTQISRYNYRIPCETSCPDTTADTCEDDIKFYTSSDETILDVSLTEFGNTIPIPGAQQTEFVYLQFTTRGHDACRDQFLYRVGSYYFNPESIPSLSDPSLFEIDYYYIDDFDVTVEAITKSPDATSNTVTLKVPNVLFSDDDSPADGRLVFGMKFVPSEQCDSSCGVTVTSVEAWSTCTAGAGCSNEVVQSSETTDLLEGWEGDITKYEDYIGRLGMSEGSISLNIDDDVDTEFVEIELGVELDSTAASFEVEVLEAP